MELVFAAFLGRILTASLVCDMHEGRICILKPEFLILTSFAFIREYNNLLKETEYAEQQVQDQDVQRICAATSSGTQPKVADFSEDRSDDEHEEIRVPVSRAWILRDGNEHKDGTIDENGVLRMGHLFVMARRIPHKPPEQGNLYMHPRFKHQRVTFRTTKGRETYKDRPGAVILPHPLDFEGLQHVFKVRDHCMFVCLYMLVAQIHAIFMNVDDTHTL